MQYQIVIPKKVRKDLRRIDNRYRFRILKAFIALAKNPFLGKKLSGGRQHEWSHYVWPYRIIYKIQNKKLIVFIVKIGHRQGIYK